MRPLNFISILLFFTLNFHCALEKVTSLKSRFPHIRKSGCISHSPRVGEMVVFPSAVQNMRTLQNCGLHFLFATPPSSLSSNVCTNSIKYHFAIAQAPVKKSTILWYIILVLDQSVEIYLWQLSTYAFHPFYRAARLLYGVFTIVLLSRKLFPHRKYYHRLGVISVLINATNNFILTFCRSEKHLSLLLITVTTRKKLLRASIYLNCQQILYPTTMNVSFQGTIEHLRHCYYFTFIHWHLLFFYVALCELFS